MIYAVECVGTEYVKFGYTDELTATGRLRDLQTGCPLELRLIASCSGGREVEQKIHMWLIKRRGRGEWFTRGVEVDAVLLLMRRDAWRREHHIAQPSTHRRFGAALDYAHRCIAEKRSLEPEKAEASPALASSRSVRDGKPFDMPEWRAERRKRVAGSQQRTAASTDNRANDSQQAVST